MGGGAEILWWPFLGEGSGLSFGQENTIKRWRKAEKTRGQRGGEYFLRLNAFWPCVLRMRNTCALLWMQKLCSRGGWFEETIWTTVCTDFRVQTVMFCSIVSWKLSKHAHMWTLRKTPSNWSNWCHCYGSCYACHDRRSSKCCLETASLEWERALLHQWQCQWPDDTCHSWLFGPSKKDTNESDLPDEHWFHNIDTWAAQGLLHCIFNFQQAEVVIREPALFTCLWH